MSRAAFHLGAALLLANRPKEAAEAFHDYTKQHPRDAAGWSGRADALRMAGLTNEAAEAGRRAAELIERAKR
jgi:predicted Zn-dependent protease